ncbi:efflux RND transporter permease subunit [Chitinivorax sp. B]|uniref:efflux RND transporter permease subunit n=1 Tax=Chitinivorax sp. B TaxID=2502235 RepID=UPI0010F73409|nr:efflux RND transporter permease subunit [Chitinivorax sp. B]
MKTGFNLTEWTLKHQQLAWFFMILTLLAGLFAYQRLGRAEDPDYTIRDMVVTLYWPGATAQEMEQQIADRVEKKLQETPSLDMIRSYSMPGQSVIFVTLRDSVNGSAVRDTWVKVRNSVGDIRHTLPDGVVGPFFNDRFDDTFGSVYAFTANDLSYAQLQQYVNAARQTLLGLRYVAKVEIVGQQNERIYVEGSSTKLAQLGLDPQLILQALKSQNAVKDAGMMETGTDNIQIRLSGTFDKLEQIRNLGIQAGNRTFRLGDIATVQRGYAEPFDTRMFYNGRPAIGLAVSMEKGGDVLKLGDNLNQAITQIRQELPMGVALNQVSDQPKVVKAAIGEFMKTLIEAVVIVLAVSFVSLGRRAGVVVALSIPLVLCAVFLAMQALHIDLHKISLGALIIALGLLVDDAIIAVEMMELKLSQGWDKLKAASYAYSATAFPMLTGTLITAAGFLPVGLSVGGASEYTGAIFWVVTIALLVSWVIAVTATPLLGFHLLQNHSGHVADNAIKPSRFNRLFTQLLSWCLRHKWMTLTITLVAFLGALALDPWVKKEFFPASTRPELIVDLTLPEGASLLQTQAVVDRFSHTLQGDPRIVNFVSYVGASSPRFVLVMDQNLGASNFAQFIILAKDAVARDALRQSVEQIFARQFENVRARARILPNGPPSPYPVMLRVHGPQHEQVVKIAEQVAQVMRRHPDAGEVHLDWHQKSKALRLEVDQDKARALGIDPEELATGIRALITGLPISQFREADKLIDVIVRLDHADRTNLAHIEALPIHLGNGRFVPLAQVAKVSLDMEHGLIWRRNRQPNITVQASVLGNAKGNDVTLAIYDNLAGLRAKLPASYHIEIAGDAEESAKSAEQLVAQLPAMLVAIMILLMLQLQSIGRTMLVLLTAPLGMIGVNTFLILFNQPMGFVAQLGVIALAGMIMRNSVILIDQIEKQIASGQNAWQAIIDSALLRFRPIMLTAAAAMLGMIPLTRSAFWGPMAVAIMGGLLVATALTLLSLPAMYAAWYRVVEPDDRQP